MLEGKPKSWEGKRFRNIHTGHVYKVTDTRFNAVIFHRVDDAYPRSSSMHYKTFAKNFVPVEEEVN